MKTITVNASKTYDVVIGNGILPEIGSRCRELSAAKTVALISDSNVAPLYAKNVEDSLTGAGFRVVSFVFPAGEQSKNADVYLQILAFLAENQLGRKDLIVALGGGVCGDMAGFAAATYLRGIDFVQVPTSLLAMVDSSVGGKTAIDLPQGKNLVGAFHQPILVLCDMALLETLPQENFLDGCGEIVKYGVLGDRNLLKLLTETKICFPREDVIARCVEMKRDVVNADEFEGGLRMLLNLGHTLGHAVEKCSHFSLSHGACVAIGLAVVTRGAVKKGYCSAEDGKAILSAISALGLPSETAIGMDDLMDSMLNDKKRTSGSITCVVPYGIGDCRRETMTLMEVRNFMEAGM
ncbi:MAG: 3-dehydroquinate synthase [Oscillospiraceae bacterium]|nr:3-dehydroquinate synthase [Oscillospiraceae bacterium]